MDSAAAQQPGQQQWQGQGAGQAGGQNIYQQLITQNNAGNVPEALNEEEIIEEGPQGGSTGHLQAGQQKVGAPEHQGRQPSPGNQPYSPEGYQGGRALQQIPQAGKQQLLSPAPNQHSESQLSQHIGNRPMVSQHGGNQPIVSQQSGNQPMVSQHSGNQAVVSQLTGNQLSPHGGNQPIVLQQSGNQPMVSQHTGNQLSQHGGNQSMVSQHSGNQPMVSQHTGNQLSQHGENQSMVSQHSGNQLSQHGGNQISQYGGNQSMVSQHGGNQLSQHGGNQISQYGGNQSMVSQHGGNQPGMYQQSRNRPELSQHRGNQSLVSQHSGNHPGVSQYSGNQQVVSQHSGNMQRVSQHGGNQQVSQHGGNQPGVSQSQHSGQLPQFSQQQLLARNQHLQQQQQMFRHQRNVIPQNSPRNIPNVGHNQQAPFPSPPMENPPNIDEQLQITNQQILENQRKIALYNQQGITIPDNQNVGPPQQQQTSVAGQMANTPFNPDPRSLISDGAHCDYVGSIPLNNSAQQPTTSDAENIRRLLTMSQSSGTGRVDVMINNGADVGNPRVHLPSVGNTGPAQQVITLSTHRPLIGDASAGTQNPNFTPTNHNTADGSMASTQNPVQVQTVSSNVYNPQSPRMQFQSPINSKNVVLEGGGKFEEGHVYLIRNKKGEETKMIWQNGQFVHFIEQQHAPQQTPSRPAEPRQRGRGRGRGQGAARGRGRGQLQGNATGFHMTHVVRGSSPLDVQRRPVPVAAVRPQMAAVQTAYSPNLRSPLIIAQRMQGPRFLAPASVGVSPQLGRTVILNTLMPPAQVSQKTAAGPTPAHAGTEETSDQSSSGEVEPRVPSVVEATADTADTAPNIPDDPDAKAICQFCGYSSVDKLKCESCGRKFNHLTKYHSKNNPDTSKRRKIDIKVSSSDSGDAGIDKKTFYGQKFAEQQQVYSSILNTSTLTLYGPNIIRKVGPGTGGGRKVRMTRNRMTKVPIPVINETVTISSDEEDSADTVPRQTPGRATPTTAADSGSQGSNGDCPESPLIPVIPITNRLVAGRRDKMEDEKGVATRGKRERSQSPIEITLNSRAVRVGSLRGVSIEPVLVSKDGLHFFIECENGSYRFHVYPQEIQQCLAKFDSSTSYIFLLTSPGCGVRTRKDLGMVAHMDPKLPPPEPFFNPRSRDMRHHMITVILDSVEESVKNNFVKIIEQFKMWGHQMDESFYMELSKEEADEILKQSSKPTTVSQGSGTPVVSDHQYSVQTEEERNRSRSPSPPKIGFAGPIIKLLTYPPPPTKGAISITNEDLYCLHEGEFLNDVIIDFYLKYLLRDKFSEVDRERTYIFSSFFYKRLTQRIRSAGVDDDPSVTPAVKRHARVKTWTRNVDLFKKDFVVIPINEHAHWFLAIICFPGLDSPCNNPFLPKPQSVPLLEETSVPTPPQPVDNEDNDNEDDDGNDDESPLPDIGQTASSMDMTENSTKPEQSKSTTSQETAENDQESGTQTSTDVANVTSPQKTDEEKTGDDGGEGKESESMETSASDTRVEKATTAGPQTKLDTGTKGQACRVIVGEALDDTTDKSPEEYSIGLKQPCIIIFDSLSGPSRSRIVTVLKEYLQVEWAAKKQGEYHRLAVRGCVPKVPQQNNYSDCGVFVLQYVESFFEDPVQDFSIPMKGLHSWFSEQRINGKREELRDLIIDLKDSYENNRQKETSNS